MIVYAKHLPYENGHLGEVVADMRRLGPPTIRVIKYNNDFYAVEGSHRLAAADYLGLKPNFVVLQPDIEDTGFWKNIKQRLPEYEFWSEIIGRLY